MKPTKLKLLLSSPFLLLLLFAFNPVKVFGQGTKITPDCVVFINITLASQTTVDVPTAPTAGGVGDNRTNQCQTYTLSYQATGTGCINRGGVPGGAECHDYRDVCYLGGDGEYGD